VLFITGKFFKPINALVDAVFTAIFVPSENQTYKCSQWSCLSGDDKMMLCSSHMQTTFVQESTANQVKTVILQQHWHVHFHKQADKMNHGARVGHHSNNKSIIINQIN